MPRKQTCKDWVEIIGIPAGLLITGFGVWIAWVALDEYKTTNRVSRRSQLQEKDKEIVSLELQRPYLSALWVTLPDDLKGKSRADAMLAAVAKLDASESSSPLEWASIADLDPLLYSPTALHDKAKERARESYLLAEFILYLINDAFDAEQSGLLTYEERETYFAYVDDLGSHPLFLLGVWYGHNGGYFTSEFAATLQRRMLDNPEIRELSGAVYKELLDPSWPAQVGNRYRTSNAALTSPQPIKSPPK